MLIVLVGPKGSGKSHIGRVLEAALGVHFFHVEPLWIAYHEECARLGRERSIAEGLDRVRPALAAALDRHRHVSVETTGASPEILEALIACAASRTRLLARIHAPLPVCLARIRSRDPALQIPLDEAAIARVHALGTAASPAFDLALENVSLSEEQIVQAFAPRIVDERACGIVTAVSRSPAHGPFKRNEPSIRLLAGSGVEGDAHRGETVQHRSRVARDPHRPNLRQVHLIHAELHDELRAAGFAVSAGQMGENVTTRGVDLLGLPAGARLHLGAAAVVELTGLRNPCAQLDAIQPGLMAATLGRDAAGRLLRKAGVMGVVRSGGEVRSGDPVRVELPAGPHRPLEPV